MTILELGTLRSQTHEKDLLVTLLTEVPLLTKQCAHGFQTFIQSQKQHFYFHGIFMHNLP